MRIILAHGTPPDDPSDFDWVGLVSLVSRHHDILSTWGVLEDKSKLSKDLAAGVLTTRDFRAFDPHLILFDGSPDMQNPAGRHARKLPWALEQEFRHGGGSIIFLRAKPDINRWESNTGYAEYGFPLAKSRGAGAVYVSCPPNNPRIVFERWTFPRELMRYGDPPTLNEVVIETPWVLDDSARIPSRRMLFWCDCDVKDPVWRYEGDLENNVRRPYWVSAWIGGNAPVFLFTGDLFSDLMIEQGQNRLFLNLLMEGIEVLRWKSGAVLSSSAPRPRKVIVDKGWRPPMYGGGRAFLSYVREDATRIDRLQHILEAAGIPVWRDTENVWPGQDWRFEIRKAITKNTLAFLACFSENSEVREVTYQNEELLLAVDEMRKRPQGRPWLIPVRFSDCSIPNYDLGAGRSLGETLQRVDLFGDKWEQGSIRLVSIVQRILSGET